MKYARIIDGVVAAVSLTAPRNRVDVDGEIQVVDDLDGWTEVPAEVHAGFVDNEDGSFSAPPPAAPAVEAVREEASRRILEIAPEWKQRNMIAYGLAALRDHGTDAANWPAEIAEMNAAFDAVWNRIKAIRERSDQLEASGSIPADYADDRHWT